MESTCRTRRSIWSLFNIQFTALKPDVLHAAGQAGSCRLPDSGWSPLTVPSHVQGAHAGLDWATPAFTGP